MGVKIQCIVFILLGQYAFGSDELIQPQPEKDPLSILGYEATKGAAAEYVPDKACSLCHMEIYQSYQHVGMSQSFSKPQNAKRIEDFGKEYFHKASQRFYRIDLEGDELIFHRYMKDSRGKPINQFKRRIDWVMGSGNRARSYLYQTPWGEIYMLPLGWYSEDHTWGMSPGFEGAYHLGIMRRANRQCLFCHNALPEVPEASDFHWDTHQYPNALPEGTGCQRCHGPGAEHMRAGILGKPHEEIRSLIVNPRKLKNKERDSVCFQCHMLPSVAIMGARRFDRSDYSFRPGQILSDYLVHVEVEELNEPEPGRFEINHHGYRFYQSKCYTKSEGKMACISCHNPHIKPESKAFRTHVSTVCLDCHQSEVEKHQPILTDGENCVGCHMPTRRTRDVVLVTMTDHYISKGPFDQESLVQPIEKKNPIITGIETVSFGNPPSGKEAELYKIISVMRNQPTSDALNALSGLLPQMEGLPITPYLDKLKGEIGQQRFSDAIKTANYINKTFGEHNKTSLWLGLAYLGLRKYGDAKEALLHSLKLKETPTVHYNLGLALFGLKQDKEALQHFDRTIEMSPNLNLPWMYKGRIYSYMGEEGKARDALVRALQLEPKHTSTYVSLIKLLRKMGKHDEAERYLQIGLIASQNKGPLQKLVIQK